jgi:hypothetical protein
VGWRDGVLIRSAVGVLMRCIIMWTGFRTLENPPSRKMCFHCFYTISFLIELKKTTQRLLGIYKTKARVEDQARQIIMYDDCPFSRPQPGP